MDAPVSGGDVGAQNGTLTIMVGGQKTDFDKCLPILQAVGETVIYCGAVGSGQAVKLCNQILCAVYTHSSSKSLKAVFLGMGSDTRMGLSLRGLLLRKSILILLFSDFLNWDEYKLNPSLCTSYLNAP
jgi:hypothetical protein